MLSFKTLEIWEDNITCMMKGLSFITNQFELLKIGYSGTIFCNAVYIYRGVCKISFRSMKSYSTSLQGK